MFVCFSGTGSHCCYPPQKPCEKARTGVRTRCQAVPFERSLINRLITFQSNLALPQQELKESCLHKEYSPWTVSNGSLMVRNWCCCKQEHKQRQRLQWCSGPPPAWANPKKPLKDHYLFIFMAQAVSSPVDEMQVYQHAGHKGNYTTQMMLKDKDLKIVCVCVCVQSGSSSKHYQRLIFYPNDLWGKASLLARLFAVIYEGLPISFNLSFYAFKVWLVFAMWLSCFNQCKTMLTLSTSRWISSE